MKPSLSPDSAGMVRDLLRSSRQGALATLMADSGAPYCSLVNVAPDADGAPLLLVSALALHTQNIVSDARVSLMLDERRAGDPLEGARIMLAGEARAATAPPNRVRRGKPACPAMACAPWMPPDALPGGWLCQRSAVLKSAGTTISSNSQSAE